MAKLTTGILGLVFAALFAAVILTKPLLVSFDQGFQYIQEYTNAGTSDSSPRIRLIRDRALL